jgi:hypothetical protein
MPKIEKELTLTSFSQDNFANQIYPEEQINSSSHLKKIGTTLNIKRRSK